MADDGTKRLLLLHVKMLLVMVGFFSSHTLFVGGVLKEYCFALGR